MIADVRKRSEKLPFVPFTIRTSDGHDCPVPTRGHIYFPPGGRKVIVAADNGVSILLPVHIGAIIESANSD
jgi:hypothetical protein